MPAKAGAQDLGCMLLVHSIHVAGARVHDVSAGCETGRSVVVSLEDV